MTSEDHLSKQLIETFNTELESLLIPLTNNLKKIERSESGDELAQMMKEISRAGRNIKVSACSIGIDELGKLAECIEKLFASQHEISLELLHSSLSAVEVMPEVMRYFIQKKPSSTHVQDVLHQLQHLLALAEKKDDVSRVGEQMTQLESDNTVSKTLDDAFVAKIAETFKIELQENLITLTEGLLQLEKGTNRQDSQNLLEEIFRIAHNIKSSARSIGATYVGDIAHQLETLFAAIQKKRCSISSKIINLCLQAIDYMHEAMDCYVAKIPLSFDLKTYLAQLERATKLSTHVGLPTSTKACIKPHAHAEKTYKCTSKFPEGHTHINELESIRVSLQNLDRISVYIEENQAIKITIEDHYSKLIKLNFKIDRLVQSWGKNTANLINNSESRTEYSEALFSSMRAELSEINNTIHLMQRELRGPMSELSVLLNGLAEEIRTLRLISVSTQLRYLPRIVRDLAHELKKEINLEIKSNHVKIDRIILDGLKDPIVHLLRNAIDHGIEKAEVRRTSGKSPQGNIIIEVNQEEKHIVFKISDDGAGINTDALTHIALQKKIITQTELDVMKQEEIFELIFRPGFSTRHVATDISGRGVGLDVVRSNVLRLKGQVSIDSKPGQGTTFFLYVPLTLATERVLIVACNGQFFAIITSSVDSLLLLKEQDIVKVEGRSTVLVKGQPVLLCSLSQILHLDEKEYNVKEHFSVVVIKKNEERIALLVDEIITEKEIVLKPLQEPLTHIPCIIGATLTGSNQINYVLNATEIIKRELLRNE